MNVSEDNIISITQYVEDHREDDLMHGIHATDHEEKKEILAAIKAANKEVKNIKRFVRQIKENPNKKDKLSKLFNKSVSKFKQSYNRLNLLENEGKEGPYEGSSTALHFFQGFVELIEKAA